ncbi:hypothetical protein D4764_16G0003070, partial [Takifugu flavidus]
IDGEPHSSRRGRDCTNSSWRSDGGPSESRGSAKNTEQNEKDRHEALLGAHLHAEPMSGQKYESTRTLMPQTNGGLLHWQPLSHDHLSVSARHGRRHDDGQKSPVL